MTRRIVRTGLQLITFIAIALTTLYFLDNRYRVLPNSIHNHLPAHQPGFVITDISIKICSSLNPLYRCNAQDESWHRIEKDLYLGTGWVSHAYIQVQRQREEDLTEEDKVVLDVKIGRLDPVTSEKEEAHEQWESRSSGLWLKRSTGRRDSDSKGVVTAIDVLFGEDAVDPRPGWEVKDTPLLLDGVAEGKEPRLSTRRGRPRHEDKPVPRVGKDGKFKIMQVSDLHLSTGVGICRDPEPPDYNGGKCDADTRTLDFIGRILDDEKPDLVVLSGDQVNGDTAQDVQSAIFKYAELFIKRSIPYVTIFGNHDAEGPLDRNAMMSLIEDLPFSLSEPGPSDIDGVGNYAVEVLARGSSQHSALTLYMLDTHAYSPDERRYKGYDWIKPSQIEWFKQTAQGLKKAHQQYTHIHLDMAFIHIPLPEYADQQNAILGSWKERVTAPGLNTHFRDALVEEGIVAVSCGHDHVNDYCALSKSSPDEDNSNNSNDVNTAEKSKLWMCYAGGSGFGGYGGYGGYHRRIRVFELDANEARITTWKRLENGDTETRLDEQVLVEGGIVVAF